MLFRSVYHFVQNDLLGNSIDGDMHYELTRGMEIQKYLGRGYCHRIKWTVANFLAALMWRRLLNSAALTTSTHRRLEGVSDGTSTQVVA